MKSNVKNKLPKSDVAIRGRGGEYSAITDETFDILNRWMQHSELTEQDLRTLLAQKPYKVQETSLMSGNREATLYVGGKEQPLRQVGAPFVWDCSQQMPYEEFRVSVCLVLLLMAAQYGNDEFRQYVENFARKYAK